MRMEITDGTIHIVNEQDGTHVSISPRRSLTVGMTRIEVGAPDLPTLHFVFEDTPDPRAAERWMWRGDTASALRLAQAIMREIDDVLERAACIASKDQSLQRQWCSVLRARFPATAIAAD